MVKQGSASLGHARRDETSSSPGGLVLRRWVSVSRVSTENRAFSADVCIDDGGRSWNVDSGLGLLGSPVSADAPIRKRRSPPKLKGPDDQPRHIERRANDGRRPPWPLWCLHARSATQVVVCGLSRATRLLEGRRRG